MRLFAGTGQIDQGTKTGVGHAFVETAAAGSQRPELGSQLAPGGSDRQSPDEETARDEAERAFGVKMRFSPGEGVKVPPWMRHSLVAAERVRDQRYEEEGPTEVLEPAFTLPPA